MLIGKAGIDGPGLVVLRIGERVIGGICSEEVVVILSLREVLLSIICKVGRVGEAIAVAAITTTTRLLVVGHCRSDFDLK